MLARAKIVLPIALFLSMLIFLDSDRAVFVTFLALVGTASTLAGRDLARVVSPKVGVIGSVLVWGAIATLYAAGIIRRAPGYSQYLVYLAVLLVGYATPLSVLIEIHRGRKRRSQHMITDAKESRPQGH